MKKIIIVGSTHGHERVGLRVLHELSHLPFTSNNVELLVGNPMASEKNIPFVESDLNRVFPGKEHGTYEEMRAYELSKKICDADLVIDIHSTKTTDLSEQSMVIVTNYDAATKAILDLIQPPKVLVMKYMSNRALISQAKVGITFEYGNDESHDVLQAMLHDISEILLQVKAIESNAFKNPRVIGYTEVYEVYDVYRKDFVGGYALAQDIANFKLCNEGSVVCVTDEGDVVKATEDFYPILFGNNRYIDILGFKGRKLV